MDTKEIKKNIIQAGRIAVDELIKVAKEPIIDFGPDISATKKLCIMDAFEIVTRIQEEEDILNEKPKEAKEEKSFKGFAEGRSK